MWINTDYINLLRKRQASTSIGASTARNMGPAGTIQIARKFLMDLKLERFQKINEAKFKQELDLTTEAFKKALPPGAGHWGSARKFLNIFLRGCAYNKYLSAHYKLDGIEPWLEVPLDSHVAKGLKEEDAGQTNLPKWPGVIHLTPEDSKIYQCFASNVACKDGVNRVDLDVKYWRRVG